MDTQRVYCPACGHDVRLASTQSTQQDGQANIPDAELVCMSVTAACINASCPVLSLPAVVMRTRLARHSMADHLPRIHAKCPTCERITDMIVVGASYCWCTECETTSATHFWDEMEIPNEQLES